MEEITEVQFSTKYKWNRNPDNYNEPSWMLPVHDKVEKVLSMESGQRRAYGPTYGTYHILLKDGVVMSERNDSSLSILQ